jgi:hypothetical protein
MRKPARSDHCFSPSRSKGPVAANPSVLLEARLWCVVAMGPLLRQTKKRSDCVRASALGATWGRGLDTHAKIPWELIVSGRAARQRIPRVGRPELTANYLTLMISTKKFMVRLNRARGGVLPEKNSDKTARISAPIFPHIKNPNRSFCWEFVLQNVSIRDIGHKKNKIARSAIGAGSLGSGAGRTVGGRVTG